MYYRELISPGESAKWQPEQRLTPHPPRMLTYPNPMQLAGEKSRLVLCWRGVGHDPNCAFSDDLGTRWSRPGTLIEAGRERPYIKYASDGKNRIHFAYTDAHPDRKEGSNLFHAYYEKGTTYRTRGTRIGAFSSSMTPDSCERQPS